MNILFLDYDGVVNTPMWDSTGTRCTYNHAFHGKVNNFQAVQWVSEFCQKYHYSIVVTSTWRFDPDYKDYLINGGLRDSVEILDRTPECNSGCRGDEIQLWLNNHPEVDDFIIIDDDVDMGHLIGHLIKCDPYIGFTFREFTLAEKLHKKLIN